MASKIYNCFSAGIASAARTPQESTILETQLSVTALSTLAFALVAIGTRNVASLPGINREWRLVLNAISKTAAYITLLQSYPLSYAESYFWAGIRNGCWNANQL